MSRPLTRTMRPLLAALGGLALLAGCASNPLAGGGDLTVAMTDAPADDAESLTITVDEVQLVASGASGEAITTVQVSDEVHAFDVLELDNGAAFEFGVLDLSEVPDGTYDQVRLFLSEATITIGGSMEGIRIPSEAQTGLKVNVEPALTVNEGMLGENAYVYLDFDAAHAVQLTADGYQMRPTAIRAVANPETVQGSVLLEGAPVEDAHVTVYDAATDEIVTSTYSDANGDFAVVTLSEGDYYLVVEAAGAVSFTTATFTLADGDVYAFGEITLSVSTS